MELLYKYNIVEQPNSVHGLDQIIEDVDDDVFYAELERRILLLINTADENDDFTDTLRTKKGNLDYGLSRSYFDWTESEGPCNYSVPSWILSLWRSNANVNGTGVFIPHTVKSKRKNKPRRKKNDKGRAIYKEVGSKS